MHAALASLEISEGAHFIMRSAWHASVDVDVVAKYPFVPGIKIKNGKETEEGQE